MLLHECVGTAMTAVTFIAHGFCVSSNMCIVCRYGLMNSGASDTQQKRNGTPTPTTRVVGNPHIAPPLRRRWVYL